MNTNVEQTSARNPTTGEIRFRKGAPHVFIATKPFSLGSQGLSVRKGTEVLYDGHTVTVDGEEYHIPTLRGAIKARWLVLEEEYDPEESYAAPRANIQVRPAIEQPGGNQGRMSISTTESDEREVGNVNQHATRTRTANTGYVRNQTGVNVVQPGTKVATQRGMMVVEEQGGVPVPNRTFRTAAGEKAKSERIELSSQKAADALNLAKNLQIEPGQGVSREEMMERLSPEERAEYEAKLDAHRAAYVDSSPKVISKVKTAKQGESLGVKFTNSVGGGSSIGSEGVVVASVGEDETETFESEGIKFTTTNGPKTKKPAVARIEKANVQTRKVTAPGPSPDMRRKVAKAVCPDFPDNYDFALSTKKKLARITADFEDRLDVIQAIFAAEDDEMKALLVQEFPQAFAA